MNQPKNNTGVLTLRVIVNNFNADMTLNQLGEILHDSLDEKTLKVFKENTKDEKWLYQIEAYSKPEGENRHSQIGKNIKTKENQNFISWCQHYEQKGK